MSHFNKLISMVFGCVLVAWGIVNLLDGLFHSRLTVLITQTIADHGALAFGFALLLLGGCIIILNLVIRPQRTVKVPGSSSQKTVQVALSTIESMAKNAALAVPGVSNVNTKIKNSRRGLILDISIHMEYHDKITAVTEQLQDDIKTLIESGTTVPVHSVQVTVVKAAGEKDAAGYRSNQKAATRQNHGDREGKQ